MGGVGQKTEPAKDAVGVISVLLEELKSPGVLTVLESDFGLLSLSC